MNPETSLWRRILRPQNFAWSVAAVAVAVLLMISEKQEDTPSGELVRRPAAPVVEPSLELIAQDEPNVDPSKRLARSLVVCCDVSEQEAGRKALVEVLEERKIAWQKTTADDAGQDVVEIEAAAGQIQAILAALESKPEVFLGVVLEQTADRPADVRQPKYRLRFILRAVESSQGGPGS